MLYAGEFQNSIGAGIQYGGIAGWQGSYVTGKNKLRLSYGFSGSAWGYDRYLTPNMSIGAQAFGNQYKTGGAVSINYKPATFQNKGWLVGLDVYRGYRTEEFAFEFLYDIFFSPDDIDIDLELKTGVSISFGYRF